MITGVEIAAVTGIAVTIAGALLVTRHLSKKKEALRARERERMRDEFLKDLEKSEDKERFARKLGLPPVPPTKIGPPRPPPRPLPRRHREGG